MAGDRRQPPLRGGDRGRGDQHSLRRPRTSRGAGITRIILASTSPARAALLRGGGVPFSTQAPLIDEQAAKERLEAEGASPPEMALALAEAKAVSLGVSDALVIGADQTLDLDGICLHKAANLAEARDNLEALRGRAHYLHSALVLIRAGEAAWSRVVSARLTMRAFSDAFLDAYLERHGEGLLGSVGAYRLEDDGVQLFAEVEGDYFTILGLPLIPLLAALRAHGALET